METREEIVDMPTPGDWFIECSDSEPPMIIDSGGEVIAFLANGGRDEYEVLENARLMQLAPDMYELLNEVINCRCGIGMYDFSGLSFHDRANMAYDAWNALEDRIRTILNEIEDSENDDYS